jgi:hypothetical protein
MESRIRDIGVIRGGYGEMHSLLVSTIAQAVD